MALACLCKTAIDPYSNRISSKKTPFNECTRAPSWSGRKRVSERTDDVVVGNSQHDVKGTSPAPIASGRLMLIAARLAAVSIVAFSAGRLVTGNASSQTTDECCVYDRVEAAARARADLARAQSGEHSRELADANDELVTALLRNGRGADASTFTLAQRTLET